MQRHEYYLLGGTVPIRVSINKRGHAYGAEVPDRATRALKLDVTYLGRIVLSDEIEEIDKVRFQQLCDQIWR